MERTQSFFVAGERGVWRERSCHCARRAGSAGRSDAGQSAVGGNLKERVGQLRVTEPVRVFVRRERGISVGTVRAACAVVMAESARWCL